MVRNVEFPFRFNMQKCGYAVPDEMSVYAAMFEDDESFVRECAARYDETNRAAAEEIGNRLGAAVRGMEERKIAFFGDSITSDRLSYGKIIEKLLPNQTFDCAVSSSRTINVLSVIDGCLAEYAPDTACVMIGSNDSVCLDKKRKNPSCSIEEFERNLNLICEKISGAGADIVLISIPPVDYERFNAAEKYWSADEKINESFNSVVEKTAKKHGAVFCDMRDVFSQYENDVLFISDGLHLSAFAHKLQAERVMETMCRHFAAEK